MQTTRWLVQLILVQMQHHGNMHQYQLSCSQFTLIQLIDWLKWVLLPNLMWMVRHRSFVYIFPVFVFVLFAVVDCGSLKLNVIVIYGKMYSVFFKCFFMIWWLAVIYGDNIWLCNRMRVLTQPVISIMSSLLAHWPVTRSGGHIFELLL